MATDVRRWRFSVEHYHRMGRVGIFGPGHGEDARVELISGDVVTMEPISAKHMNCVNRFNKHIALAVTDDLLVSVQNPIRIDDYCEPHPDLAVIYDRQHGEHNPPPDDVLLLIEVADTTFDYDRNVKLPLYAAAGIPEVWIADLNGGRITRYAEPRDGHYETTAQFRHGDTLSSLILPAITVAVDDVLPTAAE